MTDAQTPTRPGRRPLSAEEKAMRIQRAMDFNMRSILSRYIIETGVSKQTAREHEREIKRFLLVCALNETGQSIGMAGPVDELWHTFILFTQEYAEFCQQVAGRFLHHAPALPGDGRRMVRSAYPRFQTQYTELFGEAPNVAYWPAAVPAGSVAPACPSEDLCSLPPCSDPNPCDNREPEPQCNNCTGTDTDTDDDDDDDDDRDDDSDDDDGGEIETPTL
jgi:hypothetical protein